MITRFQHHEGPFQFDVGSVMLSGAEEGGDNDDTWSEAEPRPCWIMLL